MFPINAGRSGPRIESKTVQKIELEKTYDKASCKKPNDKK